MHPDSLKWLTILAAEDAEQTARSPSFTRARSPKQSSRSPKPSSSLAKVYVRLHKTQGRVVGVTGTHNQRVDELLDMRDGPYHLITREGAHVALKPSDRLVAGEYHVAAKRTPLRQMR